MRLAGCQTHALSLSTRSAECQTHTIPHAFQQLLCFPAFSAMHPLQHSRLCLPYLMFSSSCCAFQPPVRCTCSFALEVSGRLCGIRAGTVCVRGANNAAERDIYIYIYVYMYIFLSASCNHIAASASPWRLLNFWKWCWMSTSIPALPPLPPLCVALQKSKVDSTNLWKRWPGMRLRSLRMMFVGSGRPFRRSDHGPQYRWRPPAS